MTVLADGQYEVDGFLMGEGTAYVVRSFEDGGAPGRRVGDEPNAYDDGTSWGRDDFEGMALSFDVLVETPGGADAWAAAQAMVAVWRGDGVRRTPNAQQIVRVKREGAPARRAYGRTRNCTPVRSHNTGIGLVPVAADMAAADDRWYDDEPVAVTLSVVPATTGGIVTTVGGGLVGPITTAAPGAQPGAFENPGDVDTWPVITFTGPVTNPSVELVVQGARRWIVELSTTIPPGQSITVDTRPWARTVLRNDGANMSTLRTTRSSPLEVVVVPPGSSAVVFRGTSASGTGSAGIVYRPAYASY